MSILKAGLLSVSLLMTGVCVSLLNMPVAQAQSSNEIALAQKYANQFAAIKTMTGDFIQIDGQNRQLQGRFFLERPGKIRFQYDNSARMRVISDGKSIAINNRKLNTWDLYQLSQTPLLFLLGNVIKITPENLIRVEQTPVQTIIQLKDKSLGKGSISIVFDNQTNELVEWTVIDQQNNITTVKIMNVRTGVQFEKGMFTIPYQNIAMQRKHN